MITCERCNTENLDGSQYCDECGAVLSSAPRAKKPGTKPAEGDQPRVEDGGNAAEAVAAAVAPSSEITPAKPTALYVAGSDGEAAQVNGPHAKLVIHRGRSVGKEFPMSDDEIHIGRWDADGGIFPTSIWTLTIRKPRFRAVMRVSLVAATSTTSKIWVPLTGPSSTAADACCPATASHCATVMKSSSAKRFCVFK